MKTMLNKINNLTNQIELGLLTKAEAMNELRGLRGLIYDRYNEGSDTFTALIYDLIDINTLIQDTYIN